MADGAAAVAAAVEHRPDVVADGLPAARPRRRPGDGPVVAAVPGCRGRRVDRLGGRGASGRRSSPRARSPASRRTRSSRRSSPRSCRPPHRRVKLGAENTAIVLDSTADLPDAAERFPNWRVVPLYVRFGDESLRDGVEITARRVLPAAARGRRVPGDVAADARRLPRLLPGARRLRADLLAPRLGARLGDVRERRGGRGRAGRRAGDGDRLRDRLRLDRDARAGDPAPPRAGDERRGGR